MESKVGERTCLDRFMAGWATKNKPMVPPDIHSLTTQIGNRLEMPRNGTMLGCRKYFQVTTSFLKDCRECSGWLRAGMDGAPTFRTDSWSLACCLITLTATSTTRERPLYTSDRADEENGWVEASPTASASTQEDGRRPDFRHHLRRRRTPWPYIGPVVGASLNACDGLVGEARMRMD
jgi:hypothetical protein